MKVHDLEPLVETGDLIEVDHGAYQVREEGLPVSETLLETFFLIPA
jgi:hypothetical protein